MFRMCYGVDPLHRYELCRCTIKGLDRRGYFFPNTSFRYSASDIVVFWSVVLFMVLPWNTRP